MGGSQHSEYPGMFKTTTSPEPMDSCNTMTSLQPHQSSAMRYETNYPTTGGSNGGGYWAPTASSHHHSYPNYYPGNTAPASATTTNQNTYPPPPPMVLYPSLYSTVNQNQIHLHLHHNDIKPIDQYAEDVTIVGGNNVTISSGGSRGIEIGILPNTQGSDDVISRYSDRQHGDPSVWRPY